MKLLGFQLEIAKHHAKSESLQDKHLYVYGILYRATVSVCLTFLLEILSQPGLLHKRHRRISKHRSASQINFLSVSVRRVYLWCPKRVRCACLYRRGTKRDKVIVGNGGVTGRRVGFV